MSSFQQDFHRKPLVENCLSLIAPHNIYMAITYSKSMDQPGKVANPARGQMNRENEYFPVPVRA